MLQSINVMVSAGLQTFLPPPRTCTIDPPHLHSRPPPPRTCTVDRLSRDLTRSANSRVSEIVRSKLTRLSFQNKSASFSKTITHLIYSCHNYHTPDLFLSSSSRCLRFCLSLNSTIFCRRERVSEYPSRRFWAIFSASPGG